MDNLPTFGLYHSSPLTPREDSRIASNRDDQQHLELFFRKMEWSLFWQFWRSMENTAELRFGYPLAEREGYFVGEIRPTANASRFASVLRPIV